MIAIRDNSSRWKEINASEWDHERAGLRHIKILLPDADPYYAWANVEFVATDSSINEVDLLVLTPSGLHLVELKHWQGEIRGDGVRWKVRSPKGRQRQPVRHLTRMITVGPSTAAGANPTADTQARLTAALDRNAFLALLVDPSQLAPARRALLSRLELSEVDITRVLVETLRAIGVPWQLIVDSDAQPPGAPDRRNLETAVRHEVVPRITAAIDAAPGAVLLTEAAPLARYGCMDLLARLADNAVPRPAARLLLAPARRPTPVLDAEPIPVTSPAQWVWLPEQWYATPANRAARQST